MSLGLIALLAVAGALGGFLAGLVGVGGGIIFGPVLFFTLQGMGIADPILTPLTLGSSLLCTWAASLSGAVAQRKAGAIDARTALGAGAVAALAVVAMTLFVTTEPWYSRRVFQVVLGTVLVVVVARMLLKKPRPDSGLSVEAARRSALFLGMTGAAAGSLAAAAGVGGGVVLVPAFNGLVRLPLKTAAGSSTAAIVVITGVGVAMNALLGLGADVPAGAVGYVHVPLALALSLPAVVTARLGVATAHRISVRGVRISFAAFAGVVAVRLLWTALA